MTVIKSTFQNRDLIPAFAEELARVAPKMEWPHSYRWMNKSLLGTYKWPESSSKWWDTDAAMDARIWLEDELNKHAQLGMYFGSHPGNDSDFGWWPEPLTEEQQEALDKFIKEHGTGWKETLAAGWQRAAYPGPLQQLRNQRGPQWLREYVA